MPLNNWSAQRQVLAFFGFLAAVWVAMQMAVLPMGLLAGNVELVVGLSLLGLIAYWATSEADRDDGLSDVVEKTTDRAEDATEGLVDGAAALIMGLAAIVLTVGGQAADLFTAGVDVAMAVPGIAGTILTGGAGFAALFGVIGPTGLAVFVLLVVLWLIYRMED